MLVVNFHDSSSIMINKKIISSISRDIGNAGNSRTTNGLWQTCTSIRDLKECFSPTCSQSVNGTANYCQKILVARIFVTLACVTSFLSSVCSFLSALTRDRLRQILLVVGKVLTIILLTFVKWNAMNNVGFFLLLYKKSYEA